MRYFSMFSGIGGFEYGIERAYDIAKWKRIQSGRDSRKRAVDECEFLSAEQPRCVGYSEINGYASSVYRKHYPGHKNYGDATRIVPTELEDFELLVGGFPCQAFSIAGKRQGFEDVRGTLFFDIVRICEVKRPSYILLENVKGLLSHDNRRTYIKILDTLAELGYDVQAVVLNSKYFGVPQNRERVFIAGCLGGWGGREVFPFGGDDEEFADDSGAPTGGIAIVGHSGSGGERGYIHNVEGIVGALSATDYKQPKQVMQIGTALNSNGGTQPFQQDRVYDDDGVAPALAANLPGGSNNVRVGTLRTHKDGNGFREMDADVAPTIPARAREDGSGQGVVMIGASRGRGEGWEQTLEKRGDGMTNTLTGVDKDNYVVADRIRRLTPTECERLQAYPDGWTKFGVNDKGKEVLISDSQRYKCLGNSVTTTVVQYAIERMFL